MKVKITGPVADSFRDTYVAEVRFMHGDADDETVHRVALVDLDGVYDLIQFDKEWNSLEYRAARNIIDGKDNAGLMGLPGFKTVFPDGLEDWPQDNTTWDLVPERIAQYIGYSLFWYDGNGLKHNVEITEG